MKIKEFVGDEYVMNDQNLLKKAASLDLNVDYINLEKDQEKSALFMDLQHFNQYTQKRSKRDHHDTKKIHHNKMKFNQVINTLYDNLAKKLIQKDNFLIPYHGIPYPERENPMNLFKR